MTAPVASRPPGRAGPRGTGRADGRRNRARLLAAAGEELQRGRPFTLAEVAERARLSTATAYRHFSSAEEVVEAYVGGFWDDMDARARDDRRRTTSPASVARGSTRCSSGAPRWSTCEAARASWPAAPRPTRGSADCSRSPNRGSRPSCARPGRTARPSSATCWPSGTRWPTRGRSSTSARSSAGRVPASSDNLCRTVRAAIRR